MIFHQIFNFWSSQSSESIDVYSFGQLLYEMVFGKPLNQPTIDQLPSTSPALISRFTPWWRHPHDVIFLFRIRIGIYFKRGSVQERTSDTWGAVESHLVPRRDGRDSRYQASTESKSCDVIKKLMTSANIDVRSQERWRKRLERIKRVKRGNWKRNKNRWDLNLLSCSDWSIYRSVKRNEWQKRKRIIYQIVNDASGNSKREK